MKMVRLGALSWSKEVGERGPKDGGGTDLVGLRVCVIRLRRNGRANEMKMEFERTTQGVSDDFVTWACVRQFWLASSNEFSSNELSKKKIGQTGVWTA